MALGGGVGLMAAGGLLALLVVSTGWRRLRAPIAYGLLAVCGVVVGAGALLVQQDAGLGSWAIALTVLGMFAPLQGRLVLGRPGRAG